MIQLTAHDISAFDTAEKLKTDIAKGLTDEEASSRLKEYGENKLKGKKKKSNIARFFDQFKDTMILILLAAAIVSFVIACIQKTPEDFFEPLLILLIVVLNAILGVIQESRAEKALDALKTLSAPHARVIRNGEEKIIDAALLVPGDIIRLEAGDFIPADARLIRSVSMKCEESALTGESVPVDKDADFIAEHNASVGDRTNCIFSGCSVSYGVGLAVVTATGMNTEMGKIANLLDNEEESDTPLQKKLGQLGKYLGIIALAICAVIFIIGIIYNIPVLKIFMIAVSLAVSAIPEGLPAIITIVLSIGVQRMVKKRAIIRSLPAVETLGSASIICSDKTGTLTQNKMTLVKAYADGESGLEDITANNTDTIKKLLKYATLCSDGNAVFHGDEIIQVGDPTEVSIIIAAHRNGITKDELTKTCPRIAELPFDSDRKMMTSVNTIDGKTVVIVKGAFDVLAQRCVSGNTEFARELCESMSNNALRVLAVGYKTIDKLPEDLSSDTLESGLTFMGLVGMIDPPRPEAKAAVEVCKQAGIKPVMITGDHVITASAIARDLGILNEGDLSVTGREVDRFTDSELDEKVESISVYARVSPENKIRIVKSWQRKGAVVAMTGDGVNDAPALKAADIGCAMGITGTDVAKGAADMTLTDDNFATIVDAVHEGRGIYDNIKKVVGFLLGTNIGEILTVFVAMLLWHESPLMSMQLLWINLVTDSLPAIALGMEPVEKDVMNRKPKPKKESLFAGGLGIRTILQGFLFGGLALIAYYLGWTLGGSKEAGQTLAFMVLALTQIVQSFNMRSAKSLFAIGPFSNHSLDKAALISLALVAIVLFTPLRIPFGLVLLTPQLYLIGLGLIFAPLLVMECSKLFGLTRYFAKKEKR